MNGPLPSEIVSDIHADTLYRDIGLPMWVLYDRPTDMPDRLVLRLWDAMVNKPTQFVFAADSLDEIAAQIEAAPGRFVFMERFDDDDPKIMGVFL